MAIIDVVKPGVGYVKVNGKWASVSSLTPAQLKDALLKPENASAIDTSKYKLVGGSFLSVSGSAPAAYSGKSGYFVYSSNGKNLWGLVNKDGSVQMNVSAPSGGKANLTFADAKAAPGFSKVFDAINPLDQTQSWMDAFYTLEHGTPEEAAKTGFAGLQGAEYLSNAEAARLQALQNDAAFNADNANRESDRKKEAAQFEDQKNNLIDRTNRIRGEYGLNVDNTNLDYWEALGGLVADAGVGNQQGASRGAEQTANNSRWRERRGLDQGFKFDMQDQDRQTGQWSKALQLWQEGNAAQDKGIDAQREAEMVSRRFQWGTQNANDQDTWGKSTASSEYQKRLAGNKRDAVEAQQAWAASQPGDVTTPVSFKQVGGKGVVSAGVKKPVVKKVVNVVKPVVKKPVVKKPVTAKR